MTNPKDDFNELLSGLSLWQLVLIFGIILFAAGATGGYFYGQYTAGQAGLKFLDNHVTSSPENLTELNYFSIDSTYLYYIVKTNMTIEDYERNLPIKTIILGED